MNHADYMMRAIRLAKKGKTSPNPKVGAVIVNNGQIVGEGYHAVAGGPHAEVEAINMAGSKAKNATLYVTLEPCCHFGKTPPCTNAIIKAGISEVYAAMADPDQKVAGKGFKVLENAGVKVHYPLYQAESSAINEAYIKHRKTGMPLVILKSAMTLDGKIATASGDSKWITNQKSRLYAHKIRSEVDAVLIGCGTLRADNPRLSSRINNKEYFPIRIVVSSSGCLINDYCIFDQPGNCIIAVPEDTDTAMLMKLNKPNVRILKVEGSFGKIDFKSLMRILAKEGILSVLIEGGSQIAACALEARVVDKIIFFYAPKIIGGIDSISAIGGVGADLVSNAVNVIDAKIRRFGTDFAVEGRVAY